MSIARHHAEWLSLVPVSGPFLSLPVLMDAFPQGLDAHDADHARLLRLAYEEWDDSFQKKIADPSIHDAWIKFVLTKTLEFDESLLAEGQAIPQTLHVEVPEHGELLKPNIVLNDPATKKARMLVQKYPRTQDLTSYVAGSRWKASPDTRMTDLLHGTGIRLGLVTNGEHWMLVDAPKGETTGYASWYASLWREEKITLQAFRTLLSMARVFGVSDDETIEALLTKSASNQLEVTDQLGAQVRRAVEVLIQSLDKADQDHGRELLEGVSEVLLYESALTVMMRLVFLFCAEERELIPTKPFPVYEQNYSVSTISKQLRDIADQHGEELLERRYDAWPRLLAAFRAVYNGLAHDDVHMPAYGGTLFAPDRFPFLEGRAQDTTWKDTPASPLPVNNRTVLHLLEALQLLQVKVPGGGPAEARRISFRALDIEQIGHVYEGLLDHTAERATEPTLGLIGKKEPEVSVHELEQQQEKGEQPFFEFLKKTCGSSRKWQNYLDQDLDDRDERRLRTACGNDESLFERVKPFASLVRDDSFGYPVIVPQGSVFVTAGTDRRSSGTHYTPRSLTEPIVQYTLEPLVYVGPAEGKPKKEWKLKSASELLDLKICDMACGSGAFLVQAARYMSERLMEAWEVAERGEKQEREHDSTLSGTDRLAEGDGTGEALLQGDQDFSKGRVVRDGESDQTSCSVDTSEHRRGERSGAHEGIPQPSEHRTGIVSRSGDASDSQPRSGSIEPGKSGTVSCSVRRNQPDVDRTSQFTPKETLTHSSLAPHPSPLTLQITPEGKPSQGGPDETLIPTDPAERTVFAMRVITQRCLYGVDVNPLAAEMAKLSLWLLTLAKDKPFEFLDHAIKSGDSLVGIHDLEQLRHFSLKPDADDAILFSGPLDTEVDEAIKLRLELAELEASSLDDVKDQVKLHRQAEDKIARLRCAADLLVAAEFWGEGTKDKQEKVRHAAVVAGHYVERGPTDEFEEKATKERRGQKMFHWPLEFPEVIVKWGGFAGFVGNPPFLGGTRISTASGSAYQKWLKMEFPPAGDRCDLCAYFLRSASRMVSQFGCFGMIATNTLSEGDTRQGGLRALHDEGFRVFRCRPNLAWPGTANLTVSLVWMSQRDGLLSHIDDRLVTAIATDLTEGLLKAPEQLSRFPFVAGLGAKPYGSGFLLDDTEATALNGSQVVFGYFVGQDLNNLPTLTPIRWIINFGDITEPQAEQVCPRSFAILVERVKPDRLADRDRHRRTYWWQFERHAKDVYQATATLPFFFGMSRVSKYHAIRKLPQGNVYSSDVVLFATADFSMYSSLQSCFHSEWGQQEGSTHETRLRYTPSKSFSTFPFPECDNDTRIAGEQYVDCQTRYMESKKIGLTKTYNRFHDPDESSPDIQKLRDLHIVMDQAVAAAYGWDNVDLGHDFQETKQGLRFTISEPARREVLQRLLKLNHERYAEEVAQGLHDKKRGKKQVSKSKRKAARASEPRLFQ